MAKHMKTQTKKKIILITVAGILILGLVFLFLLKSPQTDHSQGLTVTDLNVGKADAAVIIHGDVIGIIDTGTEEAYPVIDGYLKANHISDIDYMILTHYDRDHIGSAALILDKYKVGDIYLPDYVSEKKYYPVLMEALNGREDVYYVDERNTLSYGDIKLDLLPADDPGELLEKENTRDNNMSLVCMLTYGENDLLFTGDIEKARIRQMLEHLENDENALDADWIKLPHHGKYQKAEKDLLEVTSPQYSVISTSSDQPPDQKLLELLEEENIENHDTISCNVVTICDGKRIKVKDTAD
jgi:competence protein ComEC